MKKQYFLNANIIDPHNSLNEVGGLIISENGEAGEEADYADRVLGYKVCYYWFFIGGLVISIGVFLIVLFGEE